MAVGEEGNPVSKLRRAVSIIIAAEGEKRCKNTEKIERQKIVKERDPIK